MQNPHRILQPIVAGWSKRHILEYPRPCRRTRVTKLVAFACVDVAENVDFGLASSDNVGDLGRAALRNHANRRVMRQQEIKAAFALPNQVANRLFLDSIRCFWSCVFDTPKPRDLDRRPALSLEREDLAIPDAMERLIAIYGKGFFHKSGYSGPRGDRG